MENGPERQKPVSLDDHAALDSFLSESPVAVVMFYTNGCGLCQSMEPVLTNVSRGTDARIATINPRDDPPLVDRYQVQSVPLFVLFVDGEPVDRRAEGFVGAKRLLSWIGEYT